MIHAHAQRNIVKRRRMLEMLPSLSFQGLGGMLGPNGLQGRVQQLAQNRLSGMGGRSNEQAAGSESGEIDWFNLSNFNLTGQPLAENEEIRIASFTVPAQTGYVYGFGETEPGKQANQGTIYFDADDSGTNPISGWLRFRSENAVGKDVDDHGRLATSRLSAPAASDPENWHKFPERNMPMVTEDSVLYLTVEVDNATNAGNTLDAANSELTMAMTQFTDGV